jgi:hypothetical protein
MATTAEVLLINGQTTEGTRLSVARLAEARSLALLP